MTGRSRLWVPVLLLLIGAAVLWGAAQMAWLDVTAFNDQSGETRRTLSGGDWQPALVPLALGALAAIAAVALVRGFAARVVGAVIVVLGVATGVLLVSAVGDVDVDRVHSVVTSGGTQARTNSGPGVSGSESVPQWSSITEVRTSPAGPAVAGIGAVALILAGLAVMVRPARPGGGDHRYVTPAARREEAAESSGGDAVDRDLWSELDDGRDPTD